MLQWSRDGRKRWWRVVSRGPLHVRGPRSGLPLRSGLFRDALELLAHISALDAARFKFIDESGVNLAMTRLYGRAPRGERVVGTVPQNYGANVTMLAALGSHGVEAVMTIDGATDAEVFRVYVEQVLRPTLRPGDIVIMDNLRAHKAAGICEAIEQAGAQVVYLPPYSPDLSPIERVLVEAQDGLAHRQGPDPGGP